MVEVCGIELDDDTSETFSMNIDDFYDYVLEKPTRGVHRMVYDGLTGDVYIADKSPGRMLNVSSDIVPMFVDGKYIGVGKIRPGSCVEWFHVPVDGDDDVEDIGIIAKIRLIGTPTRWKYKGVPK